MITLYINDDVVVLKMEDISSISSAPRNNPPCVSMTTLASVMLILLPVLSASVYRLLANWSVAKATD